MMLLSLRSSPQIQKTYTQKSNGLCVTNFIQLISPQPVDQFSQTKLHWKASNEGYLQIYGMYKSNNK